MSDGGDTNAVKDVNISSSSVHSESSETKFSHEEVLRKIIGDAIINEAKLRNHTGSGIPDNCGLRGVLWRVLLRYLPLDRTQWDDILQLERGAYEGYKELFFKRPPIDIEDEASPMIQVSMAVDIVDPKSKHVYMGRHIDGTLKGLVKGPHGEPSSSTRLKCHMEDLELLEAIIKDVTRTYPDIRWFNGEDADKIQNIMTNVLFVYAKKNSTVKYVQGMNELLGTMYYVFASDEDKRWGDHAEADTFHCFSKLMSEMEDLFIQTKDHTASGIQGRMEEVIRLLTRHDTEVSQVLMDQGISPSFYAIRWLTTLLSREFNLADTIRLWDSLWTDTDRHTFLSYLCCAMIIEMREDILKGDFSENLCLLQAYPQSSSCDNLIALANQLRINDVKDDKMASIQKHEQESSPNSVANRMFHDMMNVVTAVRSGISKVFEDEVVDERSEKAEQRQQVEEIPRIKKTDVINDALRDIGLEVVDGADRLQSFIAHYFTPTNNTVDIMDEDGIMYFDIEEEEDDEGVLVNSGLVNRVDDDNDGHGDHDHELGTISGGCDNNNALSDAATVDDNGERVEVTVSNNYRDTVNSDNTNEVSVGSTEISANESNRDRDGYSTMAATGITDDTTDNNNLEKTEENVVSL